MSEEHVLSLKEIEHERDVAFKASLTGSIEYVRMARQIESAVIAKLRRGQCHVDLLVDLVRSRARDLGKAMGLVDDVDVRGREIAAFTAGASWMTALTGDPAIETIEREAARRYRPAPPAPKVATAPSGWKYMVDDTGKIMRTTEKMSYWVTITVIPLSDAPTVGLLVPPGTPILVELSQ